MFKWFQLYEAMFENNISLINKPLIFHTLLEMIYTGVVKNIYTLSSLVLVLHSSPFKLLSLRKCNFSQALQ